MTGLHLGINCPGLGAYGGAWRRDGIDPLGTANPDFYVRIAQLAERGLFDAIFTADVPALQPTWETEPQRAGLDPVLALTAAALATEHLGVVATVSTSWHHPVNLARSIASLDRISHGRAGWNVVTSYHPLVAPYYGRDPLPPKDRRYARAREFVEVVGALWRTWTPDAIVADKATGQYARPGGVRPIDHDGDFFAVTGGGLLPPSEQGLPVVFQAGGSPEGFDLAARYADATFVAAGTLDAAHDYRARLAAASRARAPGRPAVLALPGMVVSLGATDEEAERRREEFFDGANLALLAQRLGVPVEQLDPDAPLRLPGDLFERRRQDTSEGFLRSIRFLADEGLTVRDVARYGWGHLTVAGSPKTLADTIEQWFAAGAADGFNLMFDVIDEGLPAFVDEVVPILQERGLFRRRYTGRTLRHHLGLPIPTWSFADS
ncbi:nitrilotriacetate monooxygenase component A [Actinoplanes ianthinogenes]|uniref:Nitrilotriacetate monooxygenase component A n=1 Tax=Actinoplanes ianthinogenes TaxID=122358 RepID=A0ABM7M7N0_9ACTN|nr:NtaA/DmoA family FMN-dependent monooxygenase [Actinoplanes ianthinogenes]BCJ47669.1 nitrilotriacetate monooxygenase component A [Actinoplanes ianthinogenes]GGR03339.1 nitrilotriacetate monooxygenase component A [Actinoplanes ianthinogenes]